MLYVSRILTVPADADFSKIDFTADDIDTGITIGLVDSEEAYGVVDTDDDVETFINWTDLMNAVEIYGLTIEGVITDKEDSQIVQVIPYQDMRYCSRHQVKTKVLTGVDVRTYKGEITAIIPSADITKDGTRIRLSEFAPKMSDAVYVNWSPVGRSEGPLILVVDDNIKIYGDYTNIVFCDETWDISEVTNHEMAIMLRQCVIDYSLDAGVLIDRTERPFGW